MYICVYIIVSGPETGKRKRVTRKADGKPTRLVDLGGSWREKLTLLVTHVSLPILLTHFRATDLDPCCLPCCFPLPASSRQKSSDCKLRAHMSFQTLLSRLLCRLSAGGVFFLTADRLAGALITTRMLGVIG